MTTTSGISTQSNRREGFCVLLDDGTVACWGANGAGQLGRGDDAGTMDSPTAARVVGLSNVVVLDHTCGIDKSGAIWCWGTGPYLQSDTVASTTERTPVKLPVPRARKVGIGTAVGCAVVEDGILCWGTNTFGQLAPFDSAPKAATLPPRLIAVPSGGPFRDVVVGNASFALGEDGVAVSWGANPPLGRVSPLSPDPHPVPLALGAISSIDVTEDNACATTAGIGYCWGLELWDPSDPTGPRLGRALPEPVTAPEPIVQIATTLTSSNYQLGNYVPYPQRWCAVGASGAAYCWGYNASGQAGDGTKNHAYEAVRVQGLPGPVAQVKTTLDATCALLTNGKVYCWGTNYYGQLGNGKLKVPSLAPQEVVLP